MARIYLKPGDKVQTLCTLTYGADGEFHEPNLVDSTDVRYFREDEEHQDGGEWFEVYPDFHKSRSSNPNWGRYYFDENDPVDRGEKTE